MEFMLLGLTVGFLLGYLLMRSKSAEQMNSQVNERINELKDDAVTEAQTRVQRELRHELEEPVRAELKEKLSAPLKEKAERDARKIVQDAEDESRQVLKDAQDEADEIVKKARNDAEAELEKKRKDLSKLESRLESREDTLDSRRDKLEARLVDLETTESELKDREDALSAAETELEDRKVELRTKLEEISGMSSEEARDLLIERMTGDARAEAVNRVREIEEEAEAKADRNAKKILSTTIQRWAGEYVAEKTVSVVQLPSDDLKGRIIGREGRNIRALEAATGMDIIIDDTPEAVVVSGFNPVRRQVARLTLEKLISDGRIHPSRIEEVVKKTESEVEEQIKEFGEKAAFELGVHGLHADVINLLGQLQFRTSYGQNMWSHSIEVGFLCGLMASELGVDVKAARRAGLLHDLGKALTHEQDGSHALVGAEILKRCGESELVRNAVAAHHNEEPQNSVIAHLVIAGDALSGARPGARREILGTYIKRLEDLERISASFKGVEKSYAVQAGREIRVMVENSKVNDDEAYLLSKEIAAKIQDEMIYPGQVKVCVIRETRAVEYAK